MRNVLRSKALWAVVLPIAFVGAAFAGAHCDRGKSEAADEGAVVTLRGKNAEAVAHIKEHLSAHANGEACPDCPLSMEGVTTKVVMTDDGGTITAIGNSPETIKAIQDWGNQPAGACCKHGEHT